MQFSSPGPSELEERVEERKDTILERLEDIPRGYTNPSLEDLTIHSAKEYRVATVFVDINGYSDYVSDHDAKDVLFMLNLFLPEVMELVRDFDGVAETNTGDGILAYFGAAERDDETKAETLLEFLATVKWLLNEEVNPTLESEGIETISISSGSAFGKTHISRIGAYSGNQRMNRLTSVSLSTNIAAELEEKAGTNTHLVSEGVRQNSDSDGWGKYLNDQGNHGSYQFGSESSGYTDSNYYKFTGIWNP